MDFKRDARAFPRFEADLGRLAAGVTPVFDWKKYIAATGAPKFQFLNVSVPEYLASLNRMITPEPIRQKHPGAPSWIRTTSSRFRSRPCSRPRIPQGSGCAPTNPCSPPASPSGAFID